MALYSSNYLHPNYCGAGSEKNESLGKGREGGKRDKKESKRGREGTGHRWHHMAEQLGERNTVAHSQYTPKKLTFQDKGACTV